jgi:hypothetical protein
MVAIEAEEVVESVVMPAIDEASQRQEILGGDRHSWQATGSGTTSEDRRLALEILLSRSDLCLRVSRAIRSFANEFFRSAANFRDCSDGYNP